MLWFVFQQLVALNKVLLCMKISLERWDIVVCKNHRYLNFFISQKRILYYLKKNDSIKNNIFISVLILSSICLARTELNFQIISINLKTKSFRQCFSIAGIGFAISTCECNKNWPRIMKVKSMYNKLRLQRN